VAQLQDCVIHITVCEPKSSGNLGKLCGLSPINAAEIYSMIRRREFIAGLGSAAAWPLAAPAQQRGKLPTIGYLGATQGSPIDAIFLGRLREHHADAVYIANSAFFGINRMLINNSALHARPPTMFGEPSWAEAGGLMAYGASFSGRFRRAAEVVDMILRGTKPADIPVATGAVS
jgi:hypothetical protein